MVGHAKISPTRGTRPLTSPHDQRKGREHMKSDERILGDPDFVAGLLALAQAKEKFEWKYDLKRLGYDLVVHHKNITIFPRATESTAGR